MTWKALRQWEVWKAPLRDGVKGEQTHEHYVLVVSDDLMNDQSGVAIVAPLTTTGSTSPWATPVEPGEAGIERRSWIECHQLQALSLSRKRFLRRSRPLEVDVLPGERIGLAGSRVELGSYRKCPAPVERQLVARNER